MGRIARIGADTVTNYSFLETSAYDANNPAATTSAWSNSAAMDQTFVDPTPIGVVAQGVLVTFERFPDAFIGAMVKVEPTYSDAETPAIELWTHDSVTLAWTRRRRINLTNLFVGVPSGQRKIVDMTFFPFLRTVDQVWITMAPSGASTMEFFSIQLYGFCDQTLRQYKPNTEGDPCADKNSPTYTGFEEDGVTPCSGTTFGPPSTGLPSVDICNPASIENYREALRELPGELEIFDAWYIANAPTIALLCSGIDANPPTVPTLPPMPVPTVPPLPALDLCSQDSIDAFRAALAGSPDVLAEFDAFIDQLDSDGFFDANCATPDPNEAYLDPNTLEFGTDPEPTGQPFGAGPGGQQPVAQPPAAAEPEPGGPFERKTYLLRADSGDLDFPGGTCSASQNAHDGTQAIIDAMSGSALFQNVAENDAPLHDFAIADPVYACAPSSPTQTIITSNSILFNRLRATFTSFIVNAQVLIEAEAGGGFQVCFTQADYDAIVNPSVPKILLLPTGLGTPTFSIAGGSASYDDVTTGGPIDFTVTDFNMGPSMVNLDTTYNTPRYIAVRLTVTTTDEPVINLVMVMQ